MGSRAERVVVKAWRIVLRKFGRTSGATFGGLSGFSADGRWHRASRHLDYAAESLSLAILERLVHYKRFDALEPHVLYVLDIPNAMIESAPPPPPGWDGEDLLAAAQQIGDAWCDEQRSPALRVPSAVTPGEFNLMVNARHPAWRWDWVIAGPQRFAFDDRLVELIRQPT